MKIKANDDKVYDVPDNPVWHSGPPPETGWRPASLLKNIESIRWWDGLKWSVESKPHAPSFSAQLSAQIKENTRAQKIIQLADRWWLKGGSA